MTLSAPHLDSLATLLRAAGLTITEHVHYFDVDDELVQITVQARPPYCDRGRFLVQASSRNPARLTIDWADGFPRYYFGTAACATELIAWMGARGLLPTEAAGDSELTPSMPEVPAP